MAAMEVYIYRAWTPTYPDCRNRFCSECGKVYDASSGLPQPGTDYHIDLESVQAVERRLGRTLEEVQAEEYDAENENECLTCFWELLGVKIERMGKPSPSCN